MITASHLRQEHELDAVRAFYLLFAINFVAFFVIYFAYPGSRPWILEEDMIIENLSAGLFLATTAIAAVALARSRRGVRRSALAMLGAFGVIGFLSELSFGERLFALEFPRLIGVQIDSPHDIFRLTYVFLRKLLNYPLLFGLFVVLATAVPALLAWRFWPHLRALPDWFRRFVPVPAVRALLLVCVGLLSLAMLHDTGAFGYNSATRLAEEVFELNAALALLVASVALSRTRKSGLGG